MPNSSAGSALSSMSIDRLLAAIFFQIEWAVVAVRPTRNLFHRPYPRQAAFHAAGAQHRERLFMAGNQLGKSLAGAMEVAFHLTGRYPPWWVGRRFGHAVRFWATSDTAETTRDNVQRHLLGPPHHDMARGTAAIPGRAILRTVKGRNAPGALSAVVVRHVSGAESVVGFKSYDQGRSKWQGESLDGVWFWGALLTGVSAMLGIFGVDVSDAERNVLVESVATVGAVVGTVTAVYGRLRAEKRIG